MLSKLSNAFAFGPNLAGILFAFAMLPSLALAAGKEIAWTEDYESAVQRAAATQRVLLLHFYGDYCPPCRLLEKKTFHDPALVAAMNDNLVTVKVNADQRKDLVQKYQVTRWPTDVYLFPNGDEIYRGVSNPDPTVYGQTIKRVALRHRDWTVEQNAMLAAKERRQEKAMAAITPQPPSQLAAQPNSGSVSHAVKSQSPAWAPRADALPATPAANSMARNATTFPPNAQAANGPRVIENPFATNQPIIVPAAPHANVAQLQGPTLNDSMHRSASNAVAAPIVPSKPNPQQANQPPQNDPPSMSESVSAPIQPIATQRNIASNANKHSSYRDRAAVSPSVRQEESSARPANANQTVFAETIGLDGFCPVALVEAMADSKREPWVQGSAAFAVRHRGRVYHCSSEQARQTLLREPDKYTPCLSGFDIVHFLKFGELVDGQRQFGLQDASNRIFLFANAENHEEFSRAADQYSRLLNEATQERVASEPNRPQIR